LSLNTGDFKRSAIEAIKEELRGGLWPVWKRYELVSGHEDSPSAQYILAPLVYRPDHLRWSTESVEVVWNELVNTYRPLVDTPDLFLEFARLVDDEDLNAELGTDHNAEVALAWAETYGVLGLTPTQGQELSKPTFDLFHGEGEKLSIPDPRDPERPKVVVADGTAESVLKMADVRTQHTHRRRQDVQGGQDDTVEAFALEAWTANTALSLYEAVTADSVPNIETIRHFWESMASFSGSTPPASSEEAKTWAEEWVKKATLSRIRGYVYPELYEADQGFVQGMRFESLLDAMWLQMMWLLTAGNNVRRCKFRFCRKVIAFEAPDQFEDPGIQKNARRNYKTRVDKEHCDHLCVAKEHYHRNKDKKKREHRNPNPS
jgi:hypothetical protein